ncbi:uncharacterized protein RG961_012553 [Leptosomus discolor]
MGGFGLGAAHRWAKSCCSGPSLPCGWDAGHIHAFQTAAVQHPAQLLLLKRVAKGNGGESSSTEEIAERRRVRRNCRRERKLLLDDLWLRGVSHLSGCRERAWVPLEMHRHGGPRRPPAQLVLLCLVLPATANGQGSGKGGHPHAHGFAKTRLKLELPGVSWPYQEVVKLVLQARLRARTSCRETKPCQGPRGGALDIRAHAEKRRQAQKLKNKGSSGQHSCRSPGLPECREQAVSADGALQLQSEKPPQLWTEVGWTVRLDTGQQWRILTAQKDAAVEYRKGPFSWRTDFQEDPVSLRISPVSPADSGVYSVEFQDGSGAITAVCFRVSVWEPVRPPQLQTDILHWEQDRCNLSLVCTVPGATNVSYSWSCTGKAVGHQPWLHLQVLGDTNSTVCCCNASNPVSWSTASTDAAAACRAAAPGNLPSALRKWHEALPCVEGLPFSFPSSPGLSSLVPWWAVAMFLGLALAISVAIVIAWYWRKTRGKEPPGGHVEQTLTVYEEVGKARTGREPNGTGEATVTGNTVYAVICPKKQTPSCPQEPATCTIYSTVQPRGKSPSLKRKRLDPALVFTAYAEDTGGSRHWCPMAQTSPPAPASHHLS